MNKKLSYLVLGLLLLLFLVIPVSAVETIVNEELQEFTHTGFTSTHQKPTSGAPNYHASTDAIFFKNIEKYRTFGYMIVSIQNLYVAESGVRWVSNESIIKPGRYDFEYIYRENVRPGVLYVENVTDNSGKLISKTCKIFLNEWDIGDATGTQIVKLPFYITYSTPELRRQIFPGATTDAGITSSTRPEVCSPRSEYQIYIALSAGIYWQSHIKIDKLDKTPENPVGGYEIYLYRDIEGRKNTAKLDVYDGDTLLFSSFNADGQNEHLWFEKITQVNLTSLLGRIYEFPITDPADPSPVAIYVRSAQTGALIANSHLTILDSHAGSTPAIDQDLPAGTGTFNLEKADTLRYHASATADGYTLLSPIIFGVPEGGTTIVLWMSPDAPPDVPVEEGNSTLYGYAITQGSQQPISGATVSLNGYGSTTTSSTGFYLFNNVTPGTYNISASATLHDTLTESVTVDATATQHNLALKGHHSLTVIVKDGDTLANVQNATISLSDGQESTSNPVTFNVDYGPYTITAAAGGYYPQTQSAYLDKPGTTTATVLLTARPEPVPPPEMPNYPPHNVKFTVQTLLGTPIPGVNVTAQGIQQTPSTNIIERLLGINTTSTPITTELMSGTTDTNGEINFMMIEAVKYQITIKKPGVVDQTLEIYPKEDTYPIIISTAGGPLLPDAGDPLRDIHINITTSTEGDIGHIHIDYNDTTRKTTSLSIQVTQQNATDSSAPEDVIATYTVANDANVTHTFDLPNYKGQSFFVRLEAEHPDFGTINRDYAVAFKGVRVPLGPLPDGLYIYVAGFGLTLLGGIFGATSATRGVVVIAFAGWLFYAFGWLDDLGLIAPVSLGLVSTIAVMGVIVTRYREEGYQ